MTRALAGVGGPLVGLTAVALIFTSLIGPHFVGAENLELIARQTAVVCAAALGSGDAWASTAIAQQAATQQATIPADQLDSLVAPIALYPDPLLAQTLAASTYPLEIMQLQQWLAQNPGVKDKALADAVARQPDFAPAYAALAAAQFQFLFGGPLSPRETIPISRFFTNGRCSRSTPAWIVK